MKSVVVSNIALKVVACKAPTSAADNISLSANGKLVVSILNVEICLKVWLVLRVACTLMMR